MWLEYEMLRYPDRAPGYFCVSTSYRNEPNPVPGRHEIIFPMFEFEIKGGIEELEKMERELLEHVGFELSKNEAGESSYPGDHYKNVAEKYGVKELENEHEAQLEKDYGPVFFLKSFPNYTSPFWNMAQNEEPQETEQLRDTAKKIDVIVHGMETLVLLNVLVIKKKCVVNLKPLVMVDTHKFYMTNSLRSVLLLNLMSSSNLISSNAVVEELV